MGVSAPLPLRYELPVFKPLLNVMSKNSHQSHPPQRRNPLFPGPSAPADRARPCGGRLVRPGALARGVQPADRGAIARQAEWLKLVIPRLAEQQAELGFQRAAQGRVPGTVQVAQAADL
jgi:hypothetical protein